MASIGHFAQLYITNHDKQIASRLGGGGGGARAPRSYATASGHSKSLRHHTISFIWSLSSSVADLGGGGAHPARAPPFETLKKKKKKKKKSESVHQLVWDLRDFPGAVRKVCCAPPPLC